MRPKLLFWLPRILAILFIIFVSLFALDSFSLPNWPLALLMHLIPSLVLIFIVVIAWHRPLWGGYLFIATTLAMAIWLTHSLIILLPSLIIGGLFLLQGYQSDDKRSR